MASKNLINTQNWLELSKSFFSAKPFNHIVIDNFFEPEVALNIFNDMPDYNGDIKRTRKKEVATGLLIFLSRAILA